MTRPGAITVARVLLLLSGFISVGNGLIELGPEARPAVRASGAALIVAGLLTWALVWRLRRPGTRLPALALAVAAVVTAARLGQFALLHTPTILAAIILPVLAWLRVRSARWTAAAPAGTPGPRRGIAALGAVGVTASVLVVVSGAAVAAATVPCHLPQAQAPALGDTQSEKGSPSLPPTGYLTATDGVKLAYFASIPDRPVATLVFYHGSGANSRAGYLGLGRQLAQRYHIATYLVDMRGHGASQGRRGDAPSTRQMIRDVRTAVAFVKGRHPGLPEFAGGHSAGAGLILNSESVIDPSLAGYVFLAPDFGLRSGTEQQAGASNFATVCTRPLIADVVTNGGLDAHTYAVGFAYSPEQVAAGLVNRYTTTMAIAQNPSTSAAVLASIHKPVGVWIGSADEVFVAAKVLAYARKAPLATTVEVPGADHLGVIDRGVESVGPWLDQLAARGV
jgi:alpha-beta hydrolase superfamily lysophospholipase